jgi:hypothetical protein
MNLCGREALNCSSNEDGRLDFFKYKEKRTASHLGCAGWPKMEIEERCDSYQLVGWLSFSTTINGKHDDKVN